MTEPYAIIAPRIFDGDRWHDGAALLVAGRRVLRIAPQGDLTPGAPCRRLDGIIAPGFVDLQVNGGGGVLLNDAPTLETIRTICATHRHLGTTALLPTLISDAPEIMEAALEAGAAATRDGVPGFLGLHLEGPHLAPSHKGAHDERHLRPMTDRDVERLMRARPTLPHLLVTLAPEAASAEQIGQLVQAGVIVSLGHSGATLAMAEAAFAAGATLVTHLFNAMSQLGSREPGLVGAALSTMPWAGLIADGIHVHPGNIAMAAGLLGEKLFLVSDAMAVAGTTAAGFVLNGRAVRRQAGALRLEDGTLAGADITMAEAVRVCGGRAGLLPEVALRMATWGPAEAIGAAARGHLRPGAVADFVHLDEEFRLISSWPAGEELAC